MSNLRPKLGYGDQRNPLKELLRMTEKDKTQRPKRKRGANAVTTASTLTTKTLFASTREELLEIQVGARVCFTCVPMRLIDTLRCDRTN